MRLIQDLLLTTSKPSNLLSLSGKTERVISKPPNPKTSDPHNHKCEKIHNHCLFALTELLPKQLLKGNELSVSTSKET